MTIIKDQNSQPDPNRHKNQHKFPIGAQITTPIMCPNHKPAPHANPPTISAIFLIKFRLKRTRIGRVRSFQWNSQKKNGILTFSLTLRPQLHTLHLNQAHTPIHRRFELYFEPSLAWNEQELAAWDRPNETALVTKNGILTFSLALRPHEPPSHQNQVSWAFSRHQTPQERTNNHPNRSRIDLVTDILRRTGESGE